MLFTDAVFVGIDPTAGQQPIQYAALDRDLHLIVLDQGDLESVLAFVASLESAVVAVDAPQGPSRGLMAQADIRQRYNMRPEGSTWAKWRVCEYELRRRKKPKPGFEPDSRFSAVWRKLASGKIFSMRNQAGERLLRRGRIPGSQFY